MKKVDTNALKVNQLNIIGWTIVAVVLNWPWLVAIVGISMAVGTLWPELGPFRLVYRRLLLPTGMVKPNVIDDDPAPHRFALGFGAVVVLIAAASLALGLTGAGWTLAALVALLAFINFALNYCVGCQIYFLLGRIGVLRSGKAV
jgi:hypothetical protein